jgi:pimeloyl-ACP methyl ester carboxylesterase
MPYVKNGDINIYYEVEGQGPPLMLAHSFRRNLDRWRQTGFTDALKNDYRLILFDARGHGKSDKPHDPTAYGIKMVEDVVAVLDDLRINRTNFFGYSMGAGVGFKAAVSHYGRFTSFILGGFNPYPTKVPGNTTPADESKQISILPADPEVFLRLVEQHLGRPLTPDERKAELANDFEALSACTVTWREITTLTNHDLSRISVPCLLYAGDLDPVYAGAKEASSHIPGAKFFSLPGLNHAQAGPDLQVILHVKEFLARITKA